MMPERKSDSPCESSLKEGERKSSFLRRQGVVITLCIFYLVLGAYSSWAVSPVNDEPAHLVAGIHIWRTGRYDLYCVNPPLVKQLAAVPAIILGYPGPDSLFDATETIYRTEFSRGRQFLSVDPARAIRLILYGRLICLPLGVIGLLTVVRWATSLYGKPAGYCAGLLWCASPTMLGQAPLIVADSAATSLGVLASYAFWRFLHRPDWRNTLFTGLSFGFCLLTKTFWIELFLLWPLLLLAWQITRHKHCTKDETQVGADHAGANPKYLPWLRLALIFALAVAVVNLGYGFSGFGTRLGDFEFHSSALNGKPAESFADNLEPANRFRGSWLGEIPIPFPADFIRGIDIQRRDFEIYPSGYLRGTFRVNGWWYYYLYALGVNESLGILLLIATALVWTLASASARHQIRDELILLAPAVAVFVLVSSQTRMNHYFRYVLPALPYL